jgi:hypothetical protein
MKLNYDFTKLELTENDICFDYSENPDALKETLSHVNIYYRITPVIREEKTKSLILKQRKLIIKLEKNNRVFEFDYYISHNDTKNLAYVKYSSDIYSSYQEYKKMESKVKKETAQFLNSLLYSVLCCINLEFYTSDFSFNDFCNEFDYNNDSIQAKKVYEQSSDLSHNFKKFFTRDEVENFPS